MIINIDLLIKTIFPVRQKKQGAAQLTSSDFFLSVELLQQHQ